MTSGFDRLTLSRYELDRAADRRADDAWLAGAWADPATRVVVVRDGAAAVDGPAHSPVLAFVPPSGAFDGERFFLGTDAAGRAYFGVAAVAGAQGEAEPVAVVAGAGVAPEPAGQPRRCDGENFSWRGLRELGPLLGDRDAGVLVSAVALASWHATHTHCPRCGTPTVVANAGWTRRCPQDRSEHYPRTDPAVIMAITDSDERLLLGRSPQWAGTRFSTLAGFVEPGESLEQAVRREVQEESGVQVGAVEYLGNQPWPFPCSLMLGFRGFAETTAITVSEELEEARWFTREELAAACAGGEVQLPGRVSIARRLIEHWYGGELPI